VAGDSVKVTGLREFSDAMRQIDKQLGKELQHGLKAVMERVAAAIRAKVPGSAGSAIKATATQRSAGISFPGGEGSAKYDFYPWLDFGGSTGKGHRIGKAWSGSVERSRPSGGRYVYPTLAEHGEQIAEEIGDILLGLARDVGFTTHG
jgi:hypothetical protein